MKNKTDETPLQFEHSSGNLVMSLTQVTNKGFEVEESVFRLIVPHTEMSDLVEKMLTTPDTDIEDRRKSDNVRMLVQSPMSAPELIERAYNMIVAANIKSRENRATKDRHRLVKIAKAIYGISDSEWEALDSVTEESYIVSALRGTQAMKD